jgi:pimeloyl-ACP methyl ester carboxylesterase
MILIPGLNTSGAVWNTIVGELKDRYTCHVLTLAGFAGQPAIEPPFLPTMRDALLHYIESQQLDRPVLVGHSLGGMLALWVGVAAGERVRSIITIDGVPFLPVLTNPSATADSVRPMAQSLRDRLLRASASDRVREAAVASAQLVTAPADASMVAEWAAASDAMMTAHAIAEMMTTDIRADVARISVPVLLIAPVVGTGAMANQIQQAYERQVAPIADHRLVFVENARHFVMLDNPAAVRAAMRAFLN